MPIEVQIKAAEHFSGFVMLDIVARATEISNGDSAQTVVPVMGLINAVADAPFVSVAKATKGADEDHTVNITVTSLGLVDADGSESLGLSLLSSSADIWRVRADGETAVVVNSSRYQQFALPLTVTTITLSATKHFAGAIEMVLQATALEAGSGRNRSTFVRVSGLFSPVADTPALSLLSTQISGTEDIATVVPIDELGLVDTDGSETLRTFLWSSAINLGTVFVNGRSVHGQVISDATLATLLSLQSADAAAAYSMAYSYNDAGASARELFAAVPS